MVQVYNEALDRREEGHGDSRQLVQATHRPHLREGVCLCVFMCMCKRESEREREGENEREN